MTGRLNNGLRNHFMCAERARYHSAFFGHYALFACVQVRVLFIAVIWNFLRETHCSLKNSLQWSTGGSIALLFALALAFVRVVKHVMEDNKIFTSTVFCLIYPTSIELFSLGIPWQCFSIWGSLRTGFQHASLRLLVGPHRQTEGCGL